MASDSNRCWPGYEPVPGKPAHVQGSCRPKAKSKTSKSEKSFRGKRKRQLRKWSTEHPGSRKSAAQHLSAPGEAPKSRKKATKKTATRKRTATKKTTRPATKKTTRRSATKKTTRRSPERKRAAPESRSTQSRRSGPAH